MMNGSTPAQLQSSSLPPRSAIILYGTETGTAQDLASEIARCLERRHFALVDVLPLDSVSFNLLSKYALTVFVLATTGQGEFPSNARKFWTSLLRKKLGPTTLQGVRFALVGLGSSSYLKFNWAARKLGKRVKMLGAEEVIESCECDELADGSTEGAFEEWIGRFGDEVLRRWPPAERAGDVGGHWDEDGGETSKWILKRADEIESLPSLEFNGQVQRATLSPTDSFEATLDSNDRVTPPTHWQDVRFLRLSTPASINYQPGDSLAIHPENMPNDVDHLLSLMDWHSIADTPLVLIPNPAYRKPRSLVFHLSSPLPDISTSTTPTTLRQLLTSHLDITAIPRRSFFGHLARFTTNTMHKERLLEFTNPEFLDEYYDYATRPRRSILEVLQEFDSVKLPWCEVCSVFPALRPRQFSICSGGSLNRRQWLNKTDDGDDDGHHNARGPTTAATTKATVFELLIAIVKYRTVLRKVREGVCTRYLAQLPVGSKLRNVELKREARFAGAGSAATTSSSPKNNDRISHAKHLFLIGAGTGIAPLRSLIHDKLAVPSSPSSLTAAAVPAAAAKDQPTKIILFFGARNKSADYFFSSEWERFQQLGSAHNDHNDHREQQRQQQQQLVIHTAFSRDQKTKIYVQDRLREHAEELGSVLLQDPTAVVIVCGASGQMPKAVRLALVDAVRRATAGGKEGGVEYEYEHKYGHEQRQEQGMSEAEAEQFLARMEREGRYKQETWS